MSGSPEVIALAASLHAVLGRGHHTVVTAESLTGGQLAALLSAAPGASGTYPGGVVAYAGAIKTGVLGVREETVERHGVVSAECAEEMATGVRALMDATYALSTTGVAGPTTQEDKPVGLVYVGLAGPDGVSSIELNLSGEREAIREQTCAQAVAWIVSKLVGDPV